MLCITHGTLRHVLREIWRPGSCGTVAGGRYDIGSQISAGQPDVAKAWLFQMSSDVKVELLPWR